MSTSESVSPCVCDTLCGRRTKNTLTPPFSSPTPISPVLRLWTPSEVQVYCPEPGHWGCGDAGGEAQPAHSPRDLLKTHLNSRITRSRSPRILTTTPTSRQPKPGFRAELEKEVARPLCRSESPLKCVGLAACCWPECKAPASIPDVGSQTEGYIWFASGFFS